MSIAAIVRRVARLVVPAGLVLAVSLSAASAIPALARDGERLVCNFGTEPEPGAEVTNPVFFSVAFSCFQNGALVVPAPDALLLLDGAPVEFERTEDPGTATLFTTVILANGTHTGRVIVADDGEFIWRFTVVAPGTLPKAGEGDRTTTALSGIIAGALLAGAGLAARTRVLARH